MIWQALLSETPTLRPNRLTFWCGRPFTGSVTARMLLRRYHTTPCIICRTSTCIIAQTRGGRCCNRRLCSSIVNFPLSSNKRVDVVCVSFAPSVLSTNRHPARTLPVLLPRVIHALWSTTTRYREHVEIIWRIPRIAWNWLFSWHSDWITYVFSLQPTAVWTTVVPSMPFKLFMPFRDHGVDDGDFPIGYTAQVPSTTTTPLSIVKLTTYWTLWFTQAVW